jgi:hypothetical protein
MSFLIRSTRKHDQSLGRVNPVAPRSRVSSTVQPRMSIQHRHAVGGSSQAQTQMYRPQIQKQSTSIVQEQKVSQSGISMAEGKQSKIDSDHFPPTLTEL